MANPSTVLVLLLADVAFGCTRFGWPSFFQRRGKANHAKARTPGKSVAHKAWLATGSACYVRELPYSPASCGHTVTRHRNSRTQSRQGSSSLWNTPRFNTTCGALAVPPAGWLAKPSPKDSGRGRRMLWEMTNDSFVTRKGIFLVSLNHYLETKLSNGQRSSIYLPPLMEIAMLEAGRFLGAMAGRNAKASLL